MKHFIYFSKKLYSISGNIFFYNFIAMVVIGLLESVGILLILPLLNIIGIIDVGFQDIPYFSWLFGIFDGIPERTSLIIILSFYVFIVIGQSLFNRKQAIINKRIQQKFVRHLREDTYKSLLQSNWAFFLLHRKSDLVKSLTSEIKQVKSGTNLFITFISSLIFASIQIVIAFLLSPLMTVVVMFFGLILLFLSRHFVKKSKDFGQENYDLSKAYSAGITDQLNGMKEIKSNTLEKKHISWMSSILQKAEHNSMQLLIMKLNSQIVYKATSAILIAIFVFVAIEMFKSQPAQLILIVVIFSRLWPIVSRIQSKLEKLASKLPSFEALMKLQEECRSAQEISEEEINRAETLRITEGIQCQNVYFRYQTNQASYALEDINVGFKAYEMTAIVGPSGAGKSTLIDILLGLNVPIKGTVFIDGIALKKENVLSLRNSVSYVPQDPFLFSGSIRENLLLINEQATETEIWEALEMASASEFVKRLENGLETLIGDRGVRLSGGERQRLVLARALLRKPSILILDEATSALDTQNEEQIQYALERLKGKMTIIVIAHRLSSIRNADKIIVLEKGSFVTEGTYSQLGLDQQHSWDSILGYGKEKTVRSVI
ncbi:ABC transporter ATP-binding protein [Bacillus pinisoli]|uniref:ABC transporter ATP-binding protein n=1 Tax=Bacillus pinisoli TaxID=2901866 RepID=UPI001FF5ED95|nr:ABC transporter ATP-binding protein [Bacillus pinisoli]